MKKHVFGKQFSMARKGRQALFKSLVRSILLSQKITTTKTKADVLAGLVAKYARIASKQTLAARRQLLSKLHNQRQLVDILFKLPQPISLKSIPLGKRKGDNADMVKLEIVQVTAPSSNESKSAPETKTTISKAKKAVTKLSKTTKK